MQLDKDALIELVKSFGRFIYFGILGLIAAFLTSILASGSLNDAHVLVAGQTLNVGFLVVGGIAGLAKLVDRYRHLDPATSSNGIAPKFLQG